MHSQSFGFCRQIRLPKVKLNLAFQEYTKIGHPSTLCHSKNLYLNYMVFIPNYNCSGLEGAIMTEMDPKGKSYNPQGPSINILCQGGRDQYSYSGKEICSKCSKLIFGTSLTQYEKFVMQGFRRGFKKKKKRTKGILTLTSHFSSCSHELPVSFHTNQVAIYISLPVSIHVY